MYVNIIKINQILSRLLSITRTVKGCGQVVMPRIGSTEGFVPGTLINLNCLITEAKYKNMVVSSSSCPKQ